MTHLTKTLLIAATSIAFSETAFANTAFSQPSHQKGNTIVEIAQSDIQDAQTVFEIPLNINISSLDMDKKTHLLSGQKLEYSNKLDLDYNLTEQAFIGVAKIQEDAPITGEKGGFPEGRHINPYRTVAGGGIKTKF